MQGIDCRRKQWKKNRPAEDGFLIFMFVWMFCSPEFYYYTAALWFASCNTIKNHIRLTILTPKKIHGQKHNNQVLFWKVLLLLLQTLDCITYSDMCRRCFLGKRRQCLLHCAVHPPWMQTTIILLQTMPGRHHCQTHRITKRDKHNVVLHWPHYNHLLRHGIIYHNLWLKTAIKSMWRRCSNTKFDAFGRTASFYC